jgi:hypothetical protein
MLGQRFQSPDLENFDPEIERTLKNSRTQSRASSAESDPALVLAEERQPRGSHGVLHSHNGGMYEIAQASILDKKVDSMASSVEQLTSPFNNLAPAEPNTLSPHDSCASRYSVSLKSIFCT